MEKNVHASVLKQCILFSGIEEKDYERALAVLHAEEKTYQKGEMISCPGRGFPYIGLCLQGCISLSFLSESDNEISVNHFGKGELFGESFVCAGFTCSPLHMSAIADSRVLLFSVQSILNPSEEELLDRCVRKLTVNLIREIARKNTFMDLKVRILGQKKIRDKLKIYFCAGMKYNENKISLPFNRDNLASFLGVDRSALSRELSCMKEEGILEYNGNTFTILDSKFSKCDCCNGIYTGSLLH